MILILTVLLMGFLCFGGLSFGQPIEDEFYLITPVSKDVHDPALKAFADYAKKKWNVDVKTSAVVQGTPVAYGQILEWRGKPPSRCFLGWARERFSITWQKRVCLDQIQGASENVG